VIILPDQVLIFDNKHTPEIQSFVTLLRQSIQSTNGNTILSLDETDNLPFELKALEAVLIDTVSCYSHQIQN
jgi:hypothetical protein